MSPTHPVDRASELREAETRELVAECLFACAAQLAELGETFSPGELRDEAEFQAAEARDLCTGAKRGEKK